MGKTLSRPGCLRQSPCCSKKNDRDGYNEDGYIPQRSIYDTMCINEQIDHSSAHSTLGSRRGRETDFSSNGSLGGDMFDTRSSVLLTGGRRLDERFIFDSLKLANDELRSPGGFVRSASPSVSCSSAPGGSMNKRHLHQESGKKDSLCRHSWKVLTPPKFPEPLELSPAEKNFLNPGVAFFPSSITSPQISPFSGSPFSTGTHTPSVFFSPSPIPYNQQFHRQSLPTQPSSPRPPLSELSVSALMCGQDIQGAIEKNHEIGGHENCMTEQTQFQTFKPKPVEPISEQQPTTLEPEHDTVPLLPPGITKGPTICKTSMESTWPRRLIGRRRTVRQGGAVHNLPILPPLPSLLIRSVSDKKPTPRLSPFPEHQRKVEGHLSKSMLKNELKDCSLQDWKILREIEERKAGPTKNELPNVEVVENSGQMSPLQEKPEENVDESAPSEGDVENWEAVLEMVNSLWDETWKDSDSQNLGSLRRWPLLHPPTGFGGSQASSGTSSELGAEDLLELERICRQGSIDSELSEMLLSQTESQLKENKVNVIVTQPIGHRNQVRVPTILNLAAAEALLGNQDGKTESPDSNLTLDSDSSGVFMSNTSQTSKEDLNSDGDRSVCEIDFASVALPHKGSNEQAIARVIKRSKPEIIHHKVSSLDRNQTPEPAFLSKGIHLRKIQTKAMDSSKSIDSGSQGQEICNTVKTSKTDTLLPLTSSKQDIRGTLLASGDLDPFVATDSFVYLAVSVLPPPKIKNTITFQEGASVPTGNRPVRPASVPKPGPYPDECDFLSTDSFVYLAAPECHLLVAEGRSVYDSKDSDSEDSGSRADFVQASMLGDSDWDSDLTDSDHEWDHWEELEQDVLQGLFCEDQSETDRERNGKQASEVCCQRAELAASVEQENAVVSSQRMQEAEAHIEMESVI
ncbi:hypothetical protein Baya_3174 [Bagarius yarrelli]|uniref:Uncharacterized protein n=1 Tax=Bagarius yarrelli TaxID=175774 RepID=A0A556TUN3_BAGYA|nr:hypothetical protein Baya_3174 [Bagarius yarrelli]